MSMNPDTNQFYFVRFSNSHGIYTLCELCFQARHNYGWMMTEKEKHCRVRLGRNGIEQKVPRYVVV